MTLLTIIITPVITLVFIIALQAKWAKKTAIRLPEASGSREELTGNSPTLLHIGESTVAGVGVSHINDGLTAQIIKDLDSRHHKTMDWQVLGINGAKISDLLHCQTAIKSPDVLLITTGVNDTTGFTSTSTWRKNLKQCVDTFANTDTDVYFTAVPPMEKFPLLPRPLNYFLGVRAAWLDWQLKTLCQQQGWNYLENTLDTRKEFIAPDGYHPSAEGYRQWAGMISGKIAEGLGAC
ncbi:SGNH/GDSL hydrolase family protein [Endozoicomonas ascidiicola]|uniref:SGNH/GDSL hydrolase family protein n=1 Tax=Endozoicomonas ascidiicola TaxID=1698521 RepID=UPI000AFAA9C8|nr:SGNH/GDSL hydrolase family protein [Endozoicomonas ascidiicola]